MEWMILPFKRYAEFSGRSRRMEYWMFTLLNVIVVTVLMFIVLGAGGAAGVLDAEASGDPSAGLAALFGGMGLLILVWFLVILIPSIAVTVRRLHDRDMSGWWYLGAIIGGMIPYLGFLVSIAFLVLMALPGTPGPNRFGPDPKGMGEAETFA
ncbi:DUF805 domain-containing protein [Tsuneonella sp. YG55]|uniref:DUF805 domain-containing protein n=1 Tax=Tsuneonella litorea TaxID=2976475 RepID=A0A9X3A9Q1_9SPHN|nr:DUF805 domain-containing protein [Tsuneonella litorea]MCT2559170.1 DUF805 domain-containing protein [Tsuneonella litorea]